MLELIVTLIILTTLTWLCWNEQATLSALLIAFYLAVGWLWLGLGHLAFLADPVNLAAFLVVYSAGGILWSLWKWRRWMYSETVQSELERVAKSHGPLTRDNLPALALPGSNKERIVSWIMLWPLSVVLYFFADFLADVGRWLYERLGVFYERITDGAIPNNEKGVAPGEDRR